MATCSFSGVVSLLLQWQLFPNPQLLARLIFSVIQRLLRQVVELQVPLLMMWNAQCLFHPMQELSLLCMSQLQIGGLWFPIQYI